MVIQLCQHVIFLAKRLNLRLQLTYIFPPGSDLIARRHFKAHNRRFKALLRGINWSQLAWDVLLIQYF